MATAATSQQSHQGPHAHSGSLPLTGDISFVYPMTSAVVALLFVSSVAGLLYGRETLYGADNLSLPALLGQDALALVLGLPLILTSAWHAQRGSTRALLCWMGMLFYVSYFWSFYILGIQFNILFPAYIALVSMSMYGVLALIFALDLEALKSRFDQRTPVELIGGFLIVASLSFAALWLSLIVGALRSGAVLDRVSHLVIAVDGVVLLPLTCAGGWWLWRRRPLGYAMAGLLLVKVVATFFTLVATTLVVVASGQPANRLETTMYGVGLLLAASLLVLLLRHVHDVPFSRVSLSE